MQTDGITRLTEALDLLASADPRDLQGLAQTEHTESLLTAVNRLDGIIANQLQVLHTDNITVAECGRQTKSWLIEEQCRSGPEATRRMVVARALPERPVIAAALVNGEISLEHAHTIIRLLRATPLEIRDVVEKELLDAARVVDPTSLGRFCREVKDRLGGTEDREAADQRRYDSRWLTLSDTIEGMTSISGMLDPAGAAAFKAALRALMHRGGEDDTRTTQQRRADALVSLANQVLHSGQLPDVAGDRPHVNLTLAWHDLKRDLEAEAARLADQYRATHLGGAILDGTDISIATARMIACDAGIIPVVLGGTSELLDLGRKTSTWSTAQRRALMIESDGRCGWPKCKGPADHAHHISFWSRLGPTAVTNGVYLCWFHHWLIHHSDWHITKQPDTTITVHRSPPTSTGPPGWHP
jgi:hypothetical protein